MINSRGIASRSSTYVDKLAERNFRGKGSTQRIDSKKKKKKKNKKKGQTRGREISVREAAAVRNTIYGRMRVGGVITFIDAGGVQESRAHLTTGSENHSIGWVAKDPGAEGNDISVTIVVPANNATLAVNVVGTAITITVKSSSGNSQSTASQVIQAVRDNISANALVNVNKGGKKATGNVQVQTTVNLTGGGGTWLHMVHTLCAHEIDFVEKIYLNNQELVLGGSPDPRWASGFYSGFAFATHNLGEDDQEALSDLVQQLPSKWTANDRQRGCALTYTINIFKESIYPSGEPDFAFIVKGKKLYDPRTSQTVWSNNAALVILDYLQTPKEQGCCGVLTQDIDMDSFSDAADVCDQAIPIAAGGTEPRYTINIDFEWDNEPKEMLEIFAQSIMGSIIKYNGKWRCYPGTWRAPVMSLNEDDIRGAIQITTRNQKKELYNRARGTFLDPNQDYEQVDLPVIKNSTYLSQDGGEENWFDTDLTAVTSPAQGQRLLKYQMEKSRQGINLNFAASLRCYQLVPEDVITLTIDRYGWEGKEFLVSDIDFEVSGSEGAWKIDPVLYLEETAEEIYDWDVSEETEIDPAPDTNLPDPLTAIAPSNVTLTSGTNELFLRSDGTVFSRLKVSWDLAVSPYTLYGGRYEIQFKKTSVSDWSTTETLLGDTIFHHILNVQDGFAYDVRIRAINALNYPSSWVTVANHTVIGKTAAPSNVTGFSASKSDFGIIMSWNEISDLDADLYEIRVGSTWVLGTLITQTRGTSFRWEHKTAGTYNLMIKAVDTTGNYSNSAASASLTINAPQAPTVSSSIAGPDVVFEWNKPTADFAIREYEIRYGADYASGIPVAIVTANSFILPVNWGGERTFWIAARDIAANTGTAGSTSITIENPNPVVNFVTTAVRNNIIFDWYEPEITSLPLRRYHVYRGFNLDSAEFLGSVDATFHTYIELSPGGFYYLVIAEDSAGNKSTETRSPLTNVIVPDDFFIREDEDLSNYLKDPGELVQPNYLPAGAGETASRIYFPVEVSAPVASGLPAIITTRDDLRDWQQVFIDNGWTTLQDKIDAGYGAYLSPSNTDAGEILYEIDYEVNLGQALIELSWIEVHLGPNSIPIMPSIEVSPDGVSWNVYEGYSQVFASNFRFARYRFNFQASTDFDVSYIENVRAKLQLQKEEDNIIITAVSSDVGGTLVTFTKSFIDVQDIQISANGTVSITPVYNFDFGSNPQDNFLYVFAFDKDGNRVTTQVTVRVRGATEVSL